MVTFIYGTICIILGCIVGNFVPTLSYEYSKYLAIAIMAALDSVAGAFSSKLQNKYSVTIFLSGFFINAIIAIIFTLIGQKLGVDIYLAAIFVFVYRIFNNLSAIRRIVITKAVEKKKKII